MNMDRENKISPIDRIMAFVQDAWTAKNYYDKMNETGSKLVKKYGSGGGIDIDNYYHPLLQCVLAQKGPLHAENGINLGYGKEVYDFYKKRKRPWPETSADSIKDLQNNRYGSKIGTENRNIDCRILLDNLRTRNMKNENIR